MQNYYSLQRGKTQCRIISNFLVLYLFSQQIWSVK